MSVLDYELSCIYYSFNLENVNTSFRSLVTTIEAVKSNVPVCTTVQSPVSCPNITEFKASILPSTTKYCSTPGPQGVTSTALADDSSVVSTIASVATDNTAATTTSVVVADTSASLSSILTVHQSRYTSTIAATSTVNSSSTITSIPFIVTIITASIVLVILAIISASVLVYFIIKQKLCHRKTINQNEIIGRYDIIIVIIYKIYTVVTQRNLSYGIIRTDPDYIDILEYNTSYRHYTGIQLLSDEADICV